MEYDSKVLDTIFKSKVIQPPECSQNNMYIYKADGSLLKSWKNLICFAAVSYGWNKPEADIFAATHRLYTRSQGPALTYAENFEFTDWLINRSQFTNAFLQKDTDWCVERQGVVIRGDLPSNYVIFLATLHRTTLEYMRVPRAWLYLRNYVEENVAAYLAHLFILNNNGLNYGPLNSGHAALNFEYGCRKHLENFLAANIVSPNSNFNVSTAYRGIDRLWYDKYTNGWKDVEIEKPKVNNPFLRPEEKAVEKKHIVQNWIDVNKLGDLIKWEG